METGLWDTHHALFLFTEHIQSSDKRQQQLEKMAETNWWKYSIFPQYIPLGHNSWKAGERISATFELMM